MDETQNQLGLSKTSVGMESTGYPSIDKPWLKYYSDSESDLMLPKHTVYEWIYSRNKDNENATSLMYFGKKITYRELFKATDDVIAALIQIGVKRGDVINLLVSTVPEAIYLVLACNCLGVLANFINPLFKKAQIVGRINDTESPYLFVLDKMIPMIQDIAEQTCIDTIVTIPVSNSFPLHIKLLTAFSPKKNVIGIEWNNFISLGYRKESLAEVYQPNTPVVMVYSSGTTGSAKGIVLTNEGILATCVMEKYSIPTMVESSFLAIIPIWFSTGIVSSVFVPLANGGTAVLEPQYSEENFARDIVKYKPEGIIGTASLCEFFITHGHVKDLSFIKCFISGGEPISATFEDRINAFLHEKHCSHILTKGYGQCECGSTVTLSVGKASTGDDADVGIPLLGVTVSAFDIDTNAEKKSGAVGEIRVLTPARMLGYYKRPAETEHKFWTDDKERIWVCTGDAGYVTSDGRVVILGRISDSFINESGNRIFLFNIKNAILDCSAVKRCEVVKLDEKNGGLLVAHLVLKDNFDIGTALSEIDTYLREKLPPEAIPQAYKLRESFEINATSGKINVEALKKEKDGYVDSANRPLDK